MIRNEVDTIRKLVVARVEGALTREDLVSQAKLWSTTLAGEIFASIFNVGSADVSDLTAGDLKMYLERSLAVRHGIAQAFVVQTDDQGRLLGEFIQLAEAYGKATESWAIFGNEDDAINWIVDNHRYES